MLSAGTFLNQKIPCKNLKRKQQLLPLLLLLLVMVLVMVLVGLV